MPNESDKLNHIKILIKNLLEYSIGQKYNVSLSEKNKRKEWLQKVEVVCGPLNDLEKYQQACHEISKTAFCNPCNKFERIIFYDNRLIINRLIRENTPKYFVLNGHFIPNDQSENFLSLSFNEIRAICNCPDYHTIEIYEKKAKFYAQQIEKYRHDNKDQLEQAKVDKRAIDFSNDTIERCDQQRQQLLHYREFISSVSTDLVEKNPDGFYSKLISLYLNVDDEVKHNVLKLLMALGSNPQLLSTFIDKLHERDPLEASRAFYALYGVEDGVKKDYYVLSLILNEHISKDVPASFKNRLLCSIFGANLDENFSDEKIKLIMDTIKKSFKYDPFRQLIISVLTEIKENHSLSAIERSDLFFKKTAIVRIPKRAVYPSLSKLEDEKYEKLELPNEVIRNIFSEGYFSRVCRFIFSLSKIENSLKEVSAASSYAGNIASFLSQVDKANRIFSRYPKFILKLCGIHLPASGINATRTDEDSVFQGSLYTIMRLKAANERPKVINKLSKETINNANSIIAPLQKYQLGFIKTLRETPSVVEIENYHHGLKSLTK